ncbi:MAG: hypothetical protein M1821_004846 [Bathelium mastoideum]|nr:MAG: hypothetical protein M1821_004846 [Bathelium mastoideum]KAI9689106.1 MAG: hypothetical protein M1822_000844 [Bathelium mastoideum]
MSATRDPGVEEKSKTGIAASANCLSSASFSSKYLPDNYQFAAHNATQYTIKFSYAQDLSDLDFQSCFNLVELTSSAAYKSSSRGWKPKAKKQEMSDKGMRYLLVEETGPLEDALTKDSGDKMLPKTVVEGFLSFMITEEDDYDVLYIYEIHLSPQLRRHGVGKRLMHYAEAVAMKVGVEKVMLTVFTSNEVAERFYRKIGYVEDEYSPAPKRLRNGVIKRPDYIIMSKAT